MPAHWKDERLRGRAAVAQRKRRLDLYPLCAECQRQGVIRVTDQIDHIIPLGRGGKDTDDNCQGLCLHHHAIKTASEDVSRGGAVTHPDWIGESAIPLTIVCGPPGAGKTTWVRANASEGDEVLDLDAIIEQQTGKRGHQRGTAHLTPAIRERNARLGALSRAKHGKAWLIVSAPTEAERQWWQAKLGGRIKVIDPGQAICLERIEARGTGWQRTAVLNWYRPKPWTPPKARPPARRIMADGSPEGWE